MYLRTAGRTLAFLVLHVFMRVVRVQLFLFDEAAWIELSCLLGKVIFSGFSVCWPWLNINKLILRKKHTFNNASSGDCPYILATRYWFSLEKSDYHYFGISVDFIRSKVNHLPLRGLVRAIHAIELVSAGLICVALKHQFLAYKLAIVSC